MEAIGWIRRSLVPANGSIIAQWDIYKRYIYYCASADLDIATPTTFRKYMKLVFPHIEKIKARSRRQVYVIHYKNVKLVPIVEINGLTAAEYEAARNEWFGLNFKEIKQQFVQRSKSDYYLSLIVSGISLLMYRYSTEREWKSWVNCVVFNMSNPTSLQHSVDLKRLFSILVIHSSGCLKKMLRFVIKLFEFRLQGSTRTTRPLDFY